MFKSIVNCLHHLFSHQNTQLRDPEYTEKHRAIADSPTPPQHLYLIAALEKVRKKVTTVTDPGTGPMLSI